MKNNNNIQTSTADTSSRIEKVFAKQKAASRHCAYLSMDARIQSLDKLKKILLDN